jgi:hypothetical protein
VAKAYENAQGRVSSNRLGAYLRKLNYTYPYHQSVGYLMERAGFHQAQLDIIRQFKIEYDFYIDYNMKETKYIKEWRLFVPKGF